MHTRRASRRTVLRALCGLAVGKGTTDGGREVATASEDDPSGADPGRSGATDDGPTVDDTDERSWRERPGVSVPTLVDGVAFVGTGCREVLSLDPADGEDPRSIRGVGTQGVAADGRTVTIGSLSESFPDGSDGGREAIEEPGFRALPLANRQGPATNTYEDGVRAPTLHAFGIETGVERRSIAGVDVDGVTEPSDPSSADDADDGGESDDDSESLDVDSIAGAVEEQPGFGILAPVGRLAAAAYALATRGETSERDEP